ncbi:LacI family DNA-binding transcriptional regulator [Kordiimonas sp.]|uniref:LacI family DNA-binding transcriptional regulator n=1 Tax=Kordiimonas sp. TaxID=1970157 RepID=UPI003A8E87B1
MIDQNKKPTISDVARLAGTSKRTVSRVLNGSALVNEETREKVQAVIQELHYEPNRYARGLAAKRSYLVGLVYDNPDPLFIDQVLRGLLSKLGEAGFELVVHPCTYGSSDLVQDVMQFIQRVQLDGVVIMPPVSELNYLAGALKDVGCPYVRIESVEQDRAENTVVSDDRSAIRELTASLAAQGHQRIGFVPGPTQYLSARERLAGYEAGLRDSGLNLVARYVAQQGDYSFESGMKAAEYLLKQSPAPTAIIASNDHMAVGVMNQASLMGFKVPDDLSVTGFDDSILAARVLPALTTVRRPIRQMAALAAGKLLALISGDEAASRRVQTHVQPEIVVRSSSASPGQQ